MLRHEGNHLSSSSERPGDSAISFQTHFAPVVISDRSELRGQREEEGRDRRKDVERGEEKRRRENKREEGRRGERRRMDGRKDRRKGGREGKKESSQSYQSTCVLSGKKT